MLVGTKLPSVEHDGFAVFGAVHLDVHGRAVWVEHLQDDLSLRGMGGGQPGFLEHLFGIRRIAEDDRALGSGAFRARVGGDHGVAVAADGAVAFEDDGRVCGQEPMQRAQQILSSAARYAVGDSEPGPRGQSTEDDPVTPISPVGSSRAWGKYWRAHPGVRSVGGDQDLGGGAGSVLEVGRDGGIGIVGVAGEGLAEPDGVPQAGQQYLAQGHPGDRPLAYEKQSLLARPQA
ncbi:hypothetical protein [Streptomyces sp. NPDC048636]|uniref:hypothetical protein n=1 Tax=Streptomyces sp. NPDC048636 TaxID=3155762 RepID=UPI00343D7C3E